MCVCVCVSKCECVCVRVYLCVFVCVGGTCSVLGHQRPLMVLTQTEHEFFLGCGGRGLAQVGVVSGSYEGLWWSCGSSSWFLWFLQADASAHCLLCNYHVITVEVILEARPGRGVATGGGAPEQMFMPGRCLLDVWDGINRACVLRAERVPQCVGRPSGWSSSLPDE